jgi:hypothetical protein
LASFDDDFVVAAIDLRRLFAIVVDSTVVVADVDGVVVAVDDDVAVELAVVVQPTFE